MEILSEPIRHIQLFCQGCSELIRFTFNYLRNSMPFSLFLFAEGWQCGFVPHAHQKNHRGARLGDIRVQRGEGSKVASR